MDVEYPSPGQLGDVEQTFLQIFWPAVDDWVTVDEHSTPPAHIYSGGPTGSYWQITGLAHNTQYELRFEFHCQGGGICYSGTTDFTTDGSSSSSSSSACPCSGPKPNVDIEGLAELGIRVPTSGMTNTSGLPDLQILWDGTWTTVTSLSTPPGPIIIDGRNGDYWSISQLQPATTYLLRHVYHCVGGGTCHSEVSTGTTQDLNAGDKCTTTAGCDAAGGCPTS